MASASHPPTTLEHVLVGYAEQVAGCAAPGKTVLPPPKACPGHVHAFYALGQYYVFTVLLVIMFLGMLIGLARQAMKP